MGLEDTGAATGHDGCTSRATTEDTGGARGHENGVRALLACKDTSNSSTCRTENTMKPSSHAKRLCMGLEDKGAVPGHDGCTSCATTEDTREVSALEDGVRTLLACKDTSNTSTCTTEDTMKHSSCAPEKLQGENDMCVEDGDGFSSSPEETDDCYT
jgi:hypothetical protein